MSKIGIGARYEKERKERPLEVVGGVVRLFFLSEKERKK